MLASKQVRDMRLVIASALGVACLSGQSSPASAISCPQGPYIVFFDQDVAFVDAGARQILDNAIQAAGNCGYQKTTIVGHIDTSESDGLDAKRAQTVKVYFAARGFPEEDLEVFAMGSSILRVPTGPNVSEKQNRRVEITFGPWEVSTI